MPVTQFQIVSVLVGAVLISPSTTHTSDDQLHTEGESIPDTKVNIDVLDEPVNPQSQVFLRRSTRERKSAISDDFVVYL